MNHAAPLVVALGAYDTGWHDPAGSVARAESLIADAAGLGARVVVLPEMCATGFTMASARWAEAPDGASAQLLAAAARRHQVYVLAGLATSRAGQCYNSALLFGPDGALVSAYDKQRRFGFAGEDRAYATGAAPVLADVDGMRASLFICYDLRSPELFRDVGPFVDVMFLIANWPASRRLHWDALIRARAIENQCYVVAVNRVGEADGLAYAGDSMVCDPWGQMVAPLPGGGVPLVNVSRAEVTRVRTSFPFTTDRRAEPDPFGPFAPGWRIMATVAGQGSP